MIENMPRDRYGFIKLSSVISGSRDCQEKNNIKFLTFKRDGREYVFKSGYEVQGTPYNSLAHDNYGILSELVFSRLVKNFGIESVDYDIAKKGRNEYGVISPSFYMQYPNALSLISFLRSRLEAKEIVNKCCIESLKTHDVYKALTPQQLRLLEKNAYIDAGFGNLDGHYGNLALIDNGLLKFDYSTSFIAERSQDVGFSKYGMDYYREICSTDRNLKVFMGVVNEWQSIGAFYDSVATSPYVNLQVAKEYLTELKSILHNNDGLNNIYSELVDEYNLSSDPMFFDMLRVTLEINGERMDRAVSLNQNGM